MYQFIYVIELVLALLQSSDWRRADLFEKNQIFFVQSSHTHPSMKANQKIFSNSSNCKIMLAQTIKSSFTGQFVCLFILLSTLQINSIQAQYIAFKHTATESNISNNFTVIDDSRTNGKPNKIIFVTHDYGKKPYITSPIGVWYTNGKWSIFQQNQKPLPANSKFNVLVRSEANKGVFVHKANFNNTDAHITTIDHPDTNGNPNAKIIVTQHWGATKTYNNHPIGVFYSQGKWRIFNQGRENLAVGAMFNIMVDHPKSFRHTASASTMQMGHVSKLNNSNSNNSSNAFVFVTQYWAGIYNPHPVGVWYSQGKWTVYNEDRVKMPANARFNVVAFKPIGGITSASKVTSTQLSVIPPNICPNVVEFKGNITFNGKGTVKYRFIKSDGKVGKTKSLTFETAGTKSVNTEWHLNDPELYTGWKAIETLSPNSLQSNHANFSVFRCTGTDK